MYYFFQVATKLWGHGCWLQAANYLINRIVRSFLWAWEFCENFLWYQGCRELTNCSNFWPPGWGRRIRLCLGEKAEYCSQLHLRLRKTCSYTFSPMNATITWNSGYHGPDFSRAEHSLSYVPVGHSWRAAEPALNPGLLTPNPLDRLWVVNATFLHYFWARRIFF